MTALRTRNADRKNGRCRECLSWDVVRILEGPRRGLKICLTCGHTESGRGVARFLVIEGPAPIELAR